MYHKIILVGHLGRDPEMRYTPSGQPVTTFSIATSRKWTDSDGQQRDETVWWNVTVWGKQGELCNQYLTKGRPVLIEGRIGGDRLPGTGNSEQIVPHVWQGQDGQPRARFDVTALTVRFIGARGVEAPEILPAEEEVPPDIAANEIPF